MNNVFDIVDTINELNTQRCTKSVQMKLLKNEIFMNVFYVVGTINKINFLTLTYFNHKLIFIEIKTQRLKIYYVASFSGLYTN